MPRGDKSNYTDNRKRQLSATQARQAVPLGRMRYVLGISTVLAAVALALTFLVSL
jgi:hypothetical protein